MSYNKLASNEKRLVLEDGFLEVSKTAFSLPVNKKSPSTVKKILPWILFYSSWSFNVGGNAFNCMMHSTTFEHKRHSSGIDESSGNLAKYPK